MIKHLTIIFSILFFLSSCTMKYTIVEKDNKYGCINKKGREFIPLKYEYIGGFAYNRANVKINGKWGYINKKNVMIIEPIFNAASFFSEKYAAVAIDSLFGFINTKGEKKNRFQILGCRIWI